MLENLCENDSSKWVRTHAEWAWNVAWQELSCREVYKQAVSGQDSTCTSAALQQLLPALTPSAPIWRRWFDASSLPKRQRATLESFWSHFASSRESRRKVFERELKEYCRGEKLYEHVTSRVAPWWSLKP